MSDARLADVVPARPGKVADELRDALHLLPKQVDIGRRRLGAHDDLVGALPCVHVVARLHVVVARHIELRKRFCELLRHRGMLDDAPHVVRKGEHGVVDVPALARRLEDDLKDACAVRIFIARDALHLLLRDDAELHEQGHDPAARRAQPVDGIRHEACMIERTDVFRDVSPQADALGLDDLGDLIPDAVKDDRGVVIILCHHFGGNFLPCLIEVHGIVAPRLSLPPHIEGLIPDEHAERIARP